MRTKYNGRIWVPDEQDSRFPIRTILPPKGTPRPDYRYYWSWGTENQRTTPRCVGYSGHSFMLDGPVRILNIPDADTLYFESQKRDGIAGTDYDGTNDRGLMKYLVEIGAIAEFRWAENMDDLLDTIAFVQGGLCGTDWDYSMDEPDEHGYLIPDGDVAGGHEWEIIGANFVRKDATMKQTWGEWGIDGKGRAKITFDALEELVFGREGGSFCIGTERKAA